MALGSDRPFSDRRGKMEIERGRQQEAVRNHSVRRIKCRIVQHFKIKRPMGGSRRMMDGFVYREVYPRATLAGYCQFRLEQPVDWRRRIELFQRPPMEVRAGSVRIKLRDP